MHEVHYLQPLTQILRFIERYGEMVLNGIFLLILSDLSRVCSNKADAVMIIQILWKGP